VEGTAEAGLEVAQQGVDPAELRQVVGVLAAGDDSLVLAVGSWQLAVGRWPWSRRGSRPSHRREHGCRARGAVWPSQRSLLS
jgi:hypothetical protein